MCCRYPFAFTFDYFVKERLFVVAVFRRDLQLLRNAANLGKVFNLQREIWA